MCRSCNKYNQVIEFQNRNKTIASVTGVAITKMGMFGKAVINGMRYRVRYLPGTCRVWQEV